MRIDYLQRFFSVGLLSLAGLAISGSGAAAPTIMLQERGGIGLSLTIDVDVTGKLTGTIKSASLSCGARYREYSRASRPPSYGLEIASEDGCLNECSITLSASLATYRLTCANTTKNRTILPSYTNGTFSEILNRAEVASSLFNNATSASQQPGDVSVEAQASSCRNPKRFFFRDDGSIQDQETSLIWKQCLFGQEWKGGRCVGPQAPKQSWADAMKAGGKDGHLSRSDWRLPSPNQLTDFLSQISKCSRPDQLPYVHKLVQFLWTSRAGLNGIEYSYSSSILEPTLTGSQNAAGTLLVAGGTPEQRADFDEAFDTAFLKPQREEQARLAAREAELAAREAEATKRTEERRQAILAEADFNRRLLLLGKCAVGESVFHREVINTSNSSGNALADLIWNQQTKAQYILEFEAVVEGFAGQKVRTTINSYSVKQLKAGAYVDSKEMAARIANYADKLVGKVQFYDRSRCTQ